MLAEQKKLPGNIIKKVENATSFLSIFLMFTIIVTTFMGVLLRYVFHSTIPWAEEIARWSLIWVVFGGQAYAFGTKAHVSVDVLVQKLPSKWRKQFVVLQYLISLLVFIIIGFHGLRYVMRSIASGQLAPASRLPLALPQSAVPIGSFLAIVVLVIQLVKLRKGE